MKKIACMATLLAVTFSAHSQTGLIPDKAHIPEGLEIDQAFSKDQKVKPDFAIIGKDSRKKQWDTTSYPYTALGQLVMDNSTCSASLIGPQHLLTAAHCIYSDGAFVSNVYFAPGRVGTKFTHGLYKVTDIYMPRAYMTSSNFGVGDIAVLKLASPAGDKLGWLGYKKFTKTSPEDIDKVNQYIRSSVQKKGPGAGNDAINAAIDELVDVFPDYKISYMGYSGDKNNEMWGDSCFYMTKGEEVEGYQFIRSYCDSQPGSSGSGYFNDDFYITSVRSFQSFSQENLLTDSDGKKTVYAQGDWNEVENINLALNSYATNLVYDWKRDRYGEDTIHHKLNMDSAPHIDQLKQFSITNKCSENIYIAVRYRNLKNEWVDRGFWDTPQGDYVNFTVSSDYFYFTATNNNRSWSGEDKYVELYGKTYGMVKRTLEDRGSRHINLTCK